MQHSLFTTNQSAVEPAETPTVSEIRRGRDECASAKIRQARELLCDVLLTEEGALLGAVSEDLDSIALELESLAGLQRLFELWVADAP